MLNRASVAALLTSARASYVLLSVSYITLYQLVNTTACMWEGVTYIGLV